MDNVIMTPECITAIKSDAVLYSAVPSGVELFRNSVDSVWPALPRNLSQMMLPNQ